MTRTIRASSLPLALACPASQIPPAVPLASDSPESRLGSACHQALAVLVRDGGGPFQQAIEDAASEWRVDLEEVSRLAWNGKRAWERLEGFFPDPKVEHQFIGSETDLMESLGGTLELTGHIDVYAVADGEFRILDWKTGYEDAETEQQMRCYSWLGLRFFQEIDRATAVVVRLREMTVDTYRWSRRELDAWFQGVVRDTADTTKFRSGRHCGFCPRRRECPTLIMHMAQAAVQLLDGTPARLMAMPEAMVCLYDRIRQVEDACADARNLIRAHLAAFGPIVGHDGRTLALVRQDRQEINAAAAWPVLSERFTQADLQAAAKLTKTAVTKLAMDRAARGKKGAAAKEVMEQLDSAGAITVNTIERLEIKRGNSDCNSIESGDAVGSRPTITAGDGEG